MGAIVLTVVGTAAGSYFGQPALGFAIGSALGQYFFGGNDTQDQQETRVGPRLNDLSVQSSAYGAVIPYCYAHTRIAGGLIWSTGLIETQHNTSTNLAAANQSSGKGGGGNSTQTSISYTYSASFAIGLCQGKVQGIRRLWADSKLIYQANNFNFSDPPWIRFYNGSNGQTADPTIQSYEGSLTPGFRDLAYIVFDNFQLGNFSNHIPNITCEVINDDISNCVNVTVLPYDGQQVNTVDDMIMVGVTGSAGNSYFFTSSNLQFKYNVGFASVQGGAFGINGIGYTVGSNGFINRVQLSNGAFISSVFSALNPQQILFDQGYIAVGMRSGFQDTSVGFYDVNLNILNSRLPGGSAPVSSNPQLLALKPGTTLFVGCASQGDFSTIFAYSLPPVYLHPPLGGAITVNFNELWNVAPNNPVGGIIRMVYVDTLNALFVLYETQTYYLNVTTGATLGIINFGGTDMLYDKSRSVLWILTGNSLLWIDVNNLSVINDLTPALAPYATGFRCFSIDQQGQLWITTTAGTTLVVNFFINVSDIVSDICIRAGLSTSQFDVSSLTGVCKGYVIPNMMSARAAIAQLASAFFFDAVESDGKIKFIQRGGSPALTLNWNNDLAAFNEGQTLPDIVTVTRQQTLDLPATIWVKFFNYSASYQQGAQYQRRLFTNSTIDASNAFAIAMTDEDAAQLAEILLAIAWWARETYEFSTTIKNIALDPTDLVNLQLQDGELIECRILQTDFQPPNLIGYKAVRDTANLYVSDADGAPVDFIPPQPSIYSFTLMELMDIPILRDIDNQNGFYVATCGLDPNNWTGCVVFDSTDSGNSYSQIVNNLVASTIGTCNTTLPTASPNNIWDLTNTLTVTLTSGALQSVSELDVYNGLNVALVGGEIIQFQNAVLIGTNQYQLSRLLRGRRGTEQWISTHTASENFVVLDGTTGYFVTSPTSLNNTLVQYAAVSVGNTIENTPLSFFTNTSAALKPYSVVHVNGIRDSSHDLIFDWTRRGRVSNNWIDYSDVPLSEQTEQYEIDIYDHTFTNILRTITVNPGTDTLPLPIPSFNYTAAEQITDFGSVQSSINMILYQISATVGRGFPTSVTL